MPTSGLGDSLRRLIPVFDLPFDLLLRDSVTTRADTYNVLDSVLSALHISTHIRLTTATMNTSILQMGKPRHRDIRRLA